MGREETEVFVVASRNSESLGIVSPALFLFGRGQASGDDCETGSLELHLLMHAREKGPSGRKDGRRRMHLGLICRTRGGASHIIDVSDIWLRPQTVSGRAAPSSCGRFLGLRSSVATALGPSQLHFEKRDQIWHLPHLSQSQLHLVTG